MLMGPTMTDLTEVRVPVTTLRRVCADDDGVIQRLIQGRQISVQDGKVSLVAGARAYLDAIRSEARSASLTAARDGAREARAEAAELALLIDERAMVDDADASAALAAVCGTVTSEIAIIAARTSRDMAVRRVVEDVLHTTQQEIAQAVEALDGDLGPVGKSAPSRKRKGRS